MVELVGILNVTPDSFSDGGLYITAQKAIEYATRMFNEGASLVDVGAESTRPNATALNGPEEWQRLEPVLRDLIPRYPGRISVDSYHPETIQKAASIGPVIINDVSGLTDPVMAEVILALQLPIIISHLPNMSIQKAHLEQPVHTRLQVRNDLLKRAGSLTDRGFPVEKIILDPGIGFGKTMQLNTELLQFAEEIPDYPVMIGYSRKRFLGEYRMELAPNLEAAKIAIAHGARYLRVHDVAAHRSLIESLTYI